MSGITESFMRDEYYNFLGVIRKCYDRIEERLDVVDEVEEDEEDGVSFTDIVV